MLQRGPDPSRRGIKHPYWLEATVEEGEDVLRELGQPRTARPLHHPQAQPQLRIDPSHADAIEVPRRPIEVRIHREPLSLDTHRPNQPDAGSCCLHHPAIPKRNAPDALCMRAAGLCPAGGFVASGSEHTPLAWTGERRCGAGAGAVDGYGHSGWGHWAWKSWADGDTLLLGDK